MLIKTSLAIIALGVLVCVVSGNGTRDFSLHQPECTLIDKSQPPQFIVYESKAELSSAIQLRLRNNSSCTVVVETDDNLPTELKRQPNGGIRFETVAGSQDGVKLRLHYLIQDMTRTKALKPAYGWGDSVFTYEILGGQSVVFTVPASHFKQHFDIAVPFNYLWEGRPSVGMRPGSVIHLAYFLFEDLAPK